MTIQVTISNSVHRGMRGRTDVPTKVFVRTFEKTADGGDIVASLEVLEPQECVTLTIWKGRTLKVSEE